MDGTALRELQAPLKARYKEEPASAVVTLRAQGRIGQEGLSCKVDTGRALVEAGLHPASGGTGLQACSGDMLLQALVGCAGAPLPPRVAAAGLPTRAAPAAPGAGRWGSRCWEARCGPKATSTSGERWG